MIIQRRKITTTAEMLVLLEAQQLPAMERANIMERKLRVRISQTRPIVQTQELIAITLRRNTTAGMLLSLEAQLRLLMEPVGIMKKKQQVPIIQTQPIVRTLESIVITLKSNIMAKMLV